MPVEEEVALVRQVGEALDVVHVQSILHRDIKPANLLCLPDGRVVVLDFGAAREMALAAAQSLTEIKSRGFAAPEQYRRRVDRPEPQGAYTDVYGLAATLYWLLTEEVPIESIIRHLEDHLKPPRNLRADVPAWLSDAVMAALSPVSGSRPQTMRAFLASLTPPVKPAPEPVTVKVVSEPPLNRREPAREDKRLSRRGLLLGGVAVAVGGMRYLCRPVAMCPFP